MNKQIQYHNNLNCLYLVFTWALVSADRNWFGVLLTFIFVINHIRLVLFSLTDTIVGQSLLPVWWPETTYPIISRTWLSAPAVSKSTQDTTLQAVTTTTTTTTMKYPSHCYDAVILSYCKSSPDAKNLRLSEETNQLGLWVHLKAAILYYHHLPSCVTQLKS